MCEILVIVDMQTKFIRECGAERVAKAVAEKVRLREKEGYEVLLTYDKSGGELDGAVAKACRGKKIYEKRSYGCPDLILDLKAKNPETVELAGVCTDICVITNVLGTMAFLPYSEIVVDAACCASGNESRHAAALEVMRSCNVKII